MRDLVILLDLHDRIPVVGVRGWWGPGGCLWLRASDLVPSGPDRPGMFWSERVSRLEVGVL